MNKVAEYIKNIGKSVVFGAIDVSKEVSPTSYEMIETNQDLLKTIYHGIRDYRGTLRKTKDLITGSKIWEAGEAGINNALEDIKTGKFYNNDRVDQAAASMGFDTSFDDSDLDIDFSDSDTSEDVSDGDKFIAKAADDSSRANAKAISRALVETTKYSAEVSKANTSLLYAQNAAIGREITSGLFSINDNLGKMLEFSTSVIQTHAANSTKFYDTVSKTQQEMSAMLKELVEMKRNEYKAQQEAEKNSKLKEYKKRLGYSDIVGSAGGIDLSEYAKIIGKNFSTLMDDVGLGMLNSFGDDANPLMALMSSPLQFIPTALAKALIGPNVMRAARKFDKTLSGVIGTFIARMNHYGKDLEDGDNMAMSILGRLLGVKSSVKTSIDTSNYIKGAIPFDGITKKSIVEVIPTYLSKIVALLSGKEETRYDFNNGRFVTAASIKKDYDVRQERYATEATRDVRDGMNRILKNVRFASYEEKKEMEENMKRVLIKIYNDGGHYNPNKTNDYYSYGLKNEAEKRKLNALFKKLPKHIQMQMAGNVLEMRSRANREMQDLETSGTSLYNNIFNDSSIDSHLDKDSKGRIKGLAKGIPGQASTLPIDKSGWNILDYGKAIYKELMAIRIYGTGVGGPTSLDNEIAGPKAINNNLDRIFVKSKKTKSYADKDRENLETRSRQYDEENERLRKNKDYIFLPSGNSDEDEKEIITKLKHAGTLEYGDHNLGYNHIYNIQQRRKDIRKEQERMGEITSGISKWIGNDEDYEYKAYEENGEFKQAVQDKGETFMERFKKATGFREKFEVLNSGIRNVMSKPWAYLAHSIDAADNHIYDFFFGEQEDSDHDKVKGFFGAMVKRMENTFNKFNDWLREKVIDPLYKRFDTNSFGGLMKNMLGAIGIDVDGIKDGLSNMWSNTKDAVKNKFGGFFETTKQAYKDTYKDLKDLAGIEEDDTASQLELSKDEKRAAVKTKLVSLFNKAKSEYEQAKKDSLYGDLTAKGRMNSALKTMGALKENAMRLVDKKYSYKEYALATGQNLELFNLTDSEKKFANRLEDGRELFGENLVIDEKGNVSINAKPGKKDRNKAEALIKAEKTRLKYDKIIGSDKNFFNNFTFDPKQIEEDLIKEKERYEAEAMQKVLSENFKKASDTYIELKKQAMLTNDPELNKKAQNQFKIMQALVQKADSSLTKEQKADYDKLIASIQTIDKWEAKFKPEAIQMQERLSKGLDKDFLNSPTWEGFNEYESALNNVRDYNIKYGENGLITETLNDKFLSQYEQRAIAEAEAQRQNTISSNTFEIKNIISEKLDKVIDFLRDIKDKISGGSTFGIGEHATGARYIAKSGLTTISEGEMIIPAEMNPFNPNKDKVNKQLEKANEKKIKREFISDLSKSIGMHDEGTALALSEEEKTRRKTTMSEILKNAPIEGLENLYKGGNYAARVLFLGDEKKDFGDFGDAVKDVTKDVSKYIPEGIAGGLLGGTIGLVTGLANPLLLAVGGSAISIAQNSDKVQDWLFGKKDKNGERGGGFISKESQDTFKKYFPDLTTYGIAGTTLGMVTPLGALGGLLIGSAAAYVKNSESAQRFLFGDGNDEITKERQEFIKKAIPNMAVGAGLGAVFGPFGILGGAVFGAATGLAATTSTFQEWIVGHEMYDGSREGGLIGLLRVNIVDPLKNFGLDVRNNFLGWLKEDIINPLSRSMAPIGAQLNRTLGVAIDSISKSVKEMLKKTLGHTIGARFQHYIMDPIKSVGSAMYKGAKTTAGNLISAPFKAIGAYGDYLRREDIKAGRATYMSAEERIKYAKENNIDGLMSIKDRNFDKTLASIEDVEELKKVSRLFDASLNGSRALLKEKDAATGDFRDEIQGKFGYADASKILEAFNSGDAEEAARIIESAAFKSKNGKRIFKDNEDMVNYVQSLSKKYTRLQTAEKNLQEYTKDKSIYDKDLQNQFKDLLGVDLDMNDKNALKNMQALVNKEISYKSSLSKNEEKSPLESAIDETNKKAQEQIELQRKIVYLLAANSGDNDVAKEVLADMPNKNVITNILKGSVVMGEVTTKGKYLYTEKKINGEIDEAELNRQYMSDRESGKENDSVRWHQMPDGTIVRQKLTSDGSWVLDSSDTTTNEYLNKKKKLEETQEQIAIGMKNTSDFFSTFKSWFGMDKKDKDDEKGGGFLDFIAGLFGFGKGNAITKIIGSLPTALGRLGIGAAIVSWAGPRIVDMIGKLGKSIFRGIKTVWPFSLIGGEPEYDENGNIIETTAADKANAYSTARLAKHGLDNAYVKLNAKKFKNTGNLIYDPSIGKYTLNGRTLSKELAEKITSYQAAEYSAKMGNKPLKAMLWAGKKTAQFANNFARAFIPGLGWIEDKAMAIGKDHYDDIVKFGKNTISNVLSTRKEQIADKIIKGTVGTGKGLETLDSLYKGTKELASKSENMTKLMSILESAKGTLIKYFSKFCPNATVAVNAVYDWIRTKGKTILKNKAVKIIGKFAVRALSFPVFVASGFAMGMKDADTVLGVSAKTDLSMSQRIFAGCCGALSEALFGLIDYDTIATILINAFEFAGMDMTELKTIRETSANELAAYNLKNNTNLTMEEYNDEIDPSYYKQAKNFISDKIDNTKNYFKDKFDNASKNFHKAWDPVIESVSTFTSEMWDNIKNGASQAGSEALDILTFKRNWFDFAHQDYGEAKGAGKFIVSLERSLMSIPGSVFGFIDTVADKLTGENNYLNTAITNLGDDLSKAWEASKKGISALHAIPLPESEGIGGKIRKMVNILARIPMGMVAMFNSTWDTLSSPLQALKDKFFENPNEAKEKSAETIEAESWFSSIIGRYIDNPNNSAGQGKYGRGFYSQLDPKYNIRYNAPGDTQYQTMRDSGCGPVAASNAILALSGKGTDPISAANFALSKGYKEKNGGTEPAFFGSFFRSNGIDSEYTHGSGIVSQLQKGNPVVMMGQDKAGLSDKTPYGPNPHYVTATGLDGRGNMIVQDPEGKQNARYSIKDMLRTTTKAVAAKRGGMGKFGYTMYGTGIHGRSANISREDMVAILVEITSSSEGDYGSINRNDSGEGPSIGKMQCHKAHAINLLKRISGGSSFIKYMEVNEEMPADAAKELKKLLVSEQGKKAQDEYAKILAAGNLDAIINGTGLTDPAAILYAASFANTGPNLVAGFIRRRGSKNYNNLDTIYRLFKYQYDDVARAKYGARYDKTYKMIKDIDLSNIDMAKIKASIAKYKSLSSTDSMLEDKTSGFIDSIVDAGMNMKFDMFGGKSINDLKAEFFGGESSSTTSGGFNYRPEFSASDGSRESILKAAQSMEGIPYKLGGDGVNSTDCGMFTKLAWNKAGINWQNRYVPYIVDEAKRKQLWAPSTYTPKPGDMAVVDNQKHVVLVGENNSTWQAGSSKKQVYHSPISPKDMFNSVEGYVMAPEGDEEHLSETGKGKMMNQTSIRPQTVPIRNIDNKPSRYGRAVETQTSTTNTINYTEILKQILNALLIIVQNTKGLTDVEKQSIRESQANYAKNPKDRAAFENLKHNLSRLGSRNGLGSMFNDNDDIGYLTSVLNSFATE